jgi:hypothetical protein
MGRREGEKSQKKKAEGGSQPEEEKMKKSPISLLHSDYQKPMRF